MSYENTNYHKRSVLMRMSLHVGNMLDQASKDNHVTEALIIRLAATMVEPGELAAKNKKPSEHPASAQATPTGRMTNSTVLSWRSCPMRSMSWYPAPPSAWTWPAALGWP